MSWPVRMSEDVYGVTDLRESLPQVVDKATDTKRPMIITKHSRPVAAIIDIDELQRMYDRIQELEELQDQKVILEFMAAEARGEIKWMSNEEMARFVGELVDGARKRA
ncbi:MAG: type II toxin-antitoxin system Phd/YefM family antitoxin [Chloroflexi bacterium]|nr:type II toxin-antitoxin system Phd/YefM family antitoxin [Chloroflexota bacterium]